MLSRRIYAPIVVAAFACTSCGSRSPSSPSAPPAANSTITYTAIAASDGIGIGSSVECLPFTDCPNGKGYVQVAARQLGARGFTVNLTNLSIPTAVIGRDFQDLGTQYGRFVAGNFVQNEAPVMSSKTTLVTIFAGANDVNTVTAALGGGAGASDQIGYINMWVRNFGTDFGTLLEMIRGRAPSARIVVLNLPNMGALPYLAGASALQRQAAQRLAVGMTTTVINPLVSQGAIVIDLMCDARAYQAATYSGDGFHPSDSGYEWIAAEVVTAATTAYRSPQSGCGQMSLIPQ